MVDQDPLGAGIHHFRGEAVEADALGFVLAGLCGIGATPFMIWFKNNKTARLLGALLLLAAAAVWFVTLQGSAWAHMETFGKYLPPTLAK